MRESVSSAGYGLLGIVLFAAIGVIVVLVVNGGVWLGARVYPYLGITFGIGVWIAIFIGLPLICFGRTRKAGAYVLFTISYFFGLTLWVWGLLVTYGFWGIVGVVVGVLFFGIGVVVTAILATLLHGEWLMSVGIIMTAVLVYGTRALALWAFSKAEQVEDLIVDN